MKFVIARHCKATGQEPEAELTEEGVNQSRKLATFLKEYPLRINHIISSPFTRARQSIQPFAEKEGLDVLIDDRLRERKLSDQSLDNWLEILERSFTELDLKAENNGESSNEAMNRAISLINEISAKYDSYESVLLMSHGNLVTLILKYFDDRFGFQDWGSLTNPDVYLIEKTGDVWSVQRIYED